MLAPGQGPSSRASLGRGRGTPRRGEALAAGAALVGAGPTRQLVAAEGGRCGFGGPEAREEPDEELPPRVSTPQASAYRPAYWTTSDGTMLTKGKPPKPLSAPEMITKVQGIMLQGWEAKKAQDTSALDEGRRMPWHPRVEMVRRVENHGTFSRYHGYLLGVKSGWAGCKCPAFRAGADGAAQALAEALDVDANELYLWQGTKHLPAESIATNDFRPEFSGKAKGRIFGPGCYLEESASRADDDAQEGSGPMEDMFVLLLCRAVAGKVLTTDKQDDYSEGALSGGFDSVCGLRKMLFSTEPIRETVFYNPHAVYCEYVVWYSRDFSGSLAPAAPAADGGSHRAPVQHAAPAPAPAAPAIVPAPAPAQAPTPAPAPAPARPSPAAHHAGPAELVLSGAGSAEANGVYEWRRDARTEHCEPGVWVQRGGPCCIGFQNGTKTKHPHHNKWMLFNRSGVCYVQHTAGHLAVWPGEGQWEMAEWVRAAKFGIPGARPPPWLTPPQQWPPREHLAHHRPQQQGCACQ